MAMTASIITVGTGPSGCSKKRAQSVPPSAAHAQTQSSPPVTLKLHLDRSPSPAPRQQTNSDDRDDHSRGQPIGLRFESTTTTQQPPSQIHEDQLAHLDALDARRCAADARERRREAIFRERERTARRTPPQQERVSSPRSPPSLQLPSVPSTPSPVKVAPSGKDTLATDPFPSTSPLSYSSPTSAAPLLALHSPPLLKTEAGTCDCIRLQHRS